MFASFSARFSDWLARRLPAAGRHSVTQIRSRVRPALEALEDRVCLVAPGDLRFSFHQIWNDATRHTLESPRPGDYPHKGDIITIEAALDPKNTEKPEPGFYNVALHFTSPGGMDFTLLAPTRIELDVFIYRSVKYDGEPLYAEM